MKAKSERHILQRLAALVFGNVGLKLLSLALAIVIYHTLKTKNTNNPDGNDRSFFQSR